MITGFLSKIMAPRPITSWQIDGEKMETVTDFIFLGSKITADSDCSHEIKRCLLLGRKAVINLDSVLKSRDITLPTRTIFKAMAFPVVMDKCERWTIKKEECWRTDAFELRCSRRLLRVPWRARRSNQLILKEISPEYSLEGLMLKLQYFSHLMWKVHSLEKTLCWERLKQKEKGTTEDEMAGWQYCINGPEFEQTLEMVKDRKAWCAIVHGLTKPWTLLSNWTAMTAGLMFTSHHTVSSMRQSWTCATCGHSDQYLSNCTGPSDVFQLRESYALDFSLGRRTVLWVV